MHIPPVVVVLVVALLMWLSKLSPGLNFTLPGRPIIAIVVAVLGFAIAFAGIAAFRRAKTTVDPLNPERASSIVSQGIYRYTRNPMYLGMALELLAWAIMLGNFLAFLGLPLFILYMNRYQISIEEQALEQRFGQEYLAYKQAVRRWI